MSSWSATKDLEKADSRHWSTDQDDCLKSAVMEYPPSNINWTTVSGKVGRLAYECKERWNQYLSPAINYSAWTMQEDINLLKGYVNWGHASFQNVVNCVTSSRMVRTPDHCDARLKQMMNGNPTQSAAKKLLERLKEKDYTEELVQGVWSEDPALQLEAMTQFRKLLSAEHNPPIDVVIEAGVVPKFVEFLGRHEVPKLQFEAAAALTYVALGTSKHAQVVISHKAVPLLVQLLSSGSDDVREQAIIALGAVAFDSSCRDLVLAQGALNALTDLLNKKSKLSMLRRAAWTLSYFCRGTPFAKVKAALPVLKELLSLDDEEVLTDACRALSYLSESSNGPSDQIQGWIEACIWKKFVNLLLIPALQTVGNIVTSDDFQNQAVLDAHIIKPVVQLLQHAEFDIKKKAARAISEATSRGSHAQIEFLVSQGCIKLLCDLLICPERSIVILCLQGLENILKVGEADKNNGINLFAGRVDRFGGLQKIEDLQKHKNNEIHEMAVTIFERYWDDKPKVPPDG